MADPFVGEIRPFAFGYTPENWLPCHGQQIAIAQFQALYAVITDTYGGDGRTYFCVPDLRGNVPVGAGTGPGLTSWYPGMRGGAAGVTLTHDQIPVHAHSAGADQELATAPDPNGRILAASNPAIYKDSAPDESLVAMDSHCLSTTGKGQAHENRQPFQVLNFCICYDGIWPPRP